MASSSSSCVLVTDASRGSALACIRSLGRAGMRVVAADHDRRAPGLVSRYTAASVVHPMASTDPVGAAKVLVEAATRERVDLIIPVTDASIVALRSAGPLDIPVAVADADALDATQDKLATVRLAERLGIPVPETREAESPADAATAAATLGWPVVLKPRYGHRPSALGVTYAADAVTLLQEWESLGAEGDVLVQRYHSGEGHGVEVLAHGGRVLAALQHRRLREMPVTGGASASREAVEPDPELLDHATALVGALRWTGLAMIEFKVGPAGTSLMEINGRIWGSLPLAVRAGMDFPAKLVRLYLDEPPPVGAVDAGYRRGTRSRDLELEVRWVIAVLRGRRAYPFLPFPRRSAALPVAARLAWPAGYDAMAADDRRPAAAEVRRVARRLWELRRA